MKFIEFLIVFIAIFYLVRLVFRLFLPALLRTVIKKAGSQFSRPYEEPRQQKKEGDIKIEYIPPRKKEDAAVGGKAGDFVEFEEVKTKK